MSTFAEMLESRLHPDIAAQTISRFRHGFFDDAVLNAHKVIEEKLRAITGLFDADAMELIKQAFHPNTGLLTDSRMWPSEKEGLHQLFRGAFLTFRNAPAHRFINMSSEEAFDILIMANRLYTIIEAAYRTRVNLQQAQLNPSAILHATKNSGTGNLMLDIDNDGNDEELVVTYQYNHPQIELRKAQNNQTLGTLEVLGEQLDTAFMADIDGDGNKELACLFSFTAGSVIVFYRISNGNAIKLLGTDPRTGNSIDLDFADAQILDLDGDGRLEIVSEPWDRIPDDLWPIGKSRKDHDWGRVRYVYRWNAQKRAFDLVQRELLYIGGR